MRPSFAEWRLLHYSVKVIALVSLLARPKGMNRRCVCHVALGCVPNRALYSPRWTQAVSSFLPSLLSWGRVKSFHSVTGPASAARALFWNQKDVWGHSLGSKHISFFSVGLHNIWECHHTIEDFHWPLTCPYWQVVTPVVCWYMLLLSCCCVWLTQPLPQIVYKLRATDCSWNRYFIPCSSTFRFWLLI